MPDLYTAYLIAGPDHSDPLAQHARIVILERPPLGGRARVLCDDAVWREIPEGAAPMANAGLVIPLEALPALADAVDRWRGDQPHPGTENKVLREWLAHEHRVVEGLLTSILPPRIVDYGKTSAPPLGQYGKGEAKPFA